MSGSQSWITLVRPMSDPKELKCHLAHRIHDDLLREVRAAGGTITEAQIVAVVPHPDTVAEIDGLTLLECLGEIQRDQPDAHVFVWMGSIRHQLKPSDLKGLAGYCHARKRAGVTVQLLEVQAPLHHFMQENKFLLIRGVADAMKQLPDSAKGVLQTS